MDKEGSKLRGRTGCALVVLVAIGAVVGIGLWIGHRKDAERTPCERYMLTILEAGDHCHSGVTRKAKYHVGICKRSIEPTEACFDAIRAMTCRAIDADPTGASLPACRKQP